jgi:hypothetical protein
MEIRSLNQLVGRMSLGEVEPDKSICRQLTCPSNFCGDLNCGDKFCVSNSCIVQDCTEQACGDFGCSDDQGCSADCQDNYCPP